MKKLLKFQHRKSLNQGFTTLEILISIIIALAFISVAMQSFVLAMGMKVQAQAKQRANQLIQEDLERTNVLASNIAVDHDAKCNPAATPAKTAYQNGYAQALWEAVEPAGSTQPTVQLLKMADGTTAGKTFVLIRNQIDYVSNPSDPDDAPYRTLKINYQVQELDDSGNAIVDDTGNPIVIAERYVEVIPDVALQCP
jgi:type II secretory pathway pseudopilin PulG